MLNETARLHLINQLTAGQIRSQSQDWYAVKNRILTSTNIAAILEYSPYQTKREMLERKIAQTSTLSDHPAVLWGIKYEAMARTLCATRIGHFLHETGLKCHPVRFWNFLGATPDGIGIDDNDRPFLVEFKCLAVRSITGQIPLDYWVQMQIAMEVWGVDRCLYSENIFREYTDQASWLADPAPAANKGTFAPCLDAWWVLTEHWDVWVERSREWWLTVAPSIREFWEDVERGRCGLLPPIPSAVSTGTAVPAIHEPSSDGGQLICRNGEMAKQDLVSSLPPRGKRRRTEDETTSHSRVVAPTAPLGGRSLASHSSHSSRAFYHYREIDWTQGIRASQLSAYLKSDPLMDWLSLHGSANGYHPDAASPFQMHDYVFDQSASFREHLYKALKEACRTHQLNWCDVSEITELATVREPLLISYNYHSVRSLNKTVTAMLTNVPVIFNGLLYHKEQGLFGRADLLVPENLLSTLFPDAELPHSHGDGTHYVAVNFKYATVDLDATATRLMASPKHREYQMQCLMLSSILSYLQGCEVPRSYLVTRKLRSKRYQQVIPHAIATTVTVPVPSQETPETPRRKRARKSAASVTTLPSPAPGFFSTDCLRNLCPIDMTDPDLMAELQGGVTWLRQVRRNGRTWNPEAPGINHLSLCPNMKNHCDAPWRGAKSTIATHTGELTQVMNLGVSSRQELLQMGYQHWHDLTLTALQEARVREASLVAKILAANHPVGRLTDGITARQPLDLTDVKSSADFALPVAPIEFFIDFETVTDLYDEFGLFPQIDGHDMIYLIGCLLSRPATGQTEYRTFIVERLTLEAERAMFEDFCAWLSSVTSTPPNTTVAPYRLHHWSAAERSYLRHIEERHGLSLPPNVVLHDLYAVFRHNQITVQGSFCYALKSVAKAFYHHGLIQTTWRDGLNGAQASVGAWRAMEESLIDGLPFRETSMMPVLKAYNYNDCKVLQEMLQAVREQLGLIRPT